MRLRHLGGGDVLALPAEGVADAVDEIEEAALVRRIRSPVRNQASPGSNTSRRIFLSGILLVGVALEAAAGAAPWRSGEDPADRLADLVGGAADAEPDRVARPARPSRRRTRSARSAGGAPGTAGCGRWRPARPRHCRARSCLRWRHRTRGSAGCRKRSLNAFQTSGRKPVAAGEPDPMLALARMRRRLHQIAAELADILEQRAVEARRRRPRIAARRTSPGSAPSRRSPAALRSPRCRRRCDTSAGNHTSGRSGAYPSCRRTMAPLQQALMADIGGLGQPGGAGRVDVERPILDGDRAQLGRRSAARRIGARWRGRCAESASASAGPAQRHAPRCGADSPRRGARSRTAPSSSAATMMCLGATMLMQWASAAPVRLVLRSATMPPIRRHAEPDRQIFGPVRHHEADRIALAPRPARAPSAHSGWRARRAPGRSGSRGRKAAPGHRRRLPPSSSIKAGSVRARMGGDRCRGRQCAQPGLGGGIAASASVPSVRVRARSWRGPLPGLPVSWQA